MTHNNILIFPAFDEYIARRPTVIGGMAGRYSSGIEHHMSRHTKPSVEKPLLVAVDLHLRWVADFHLIEELEDGRDPDDWGAYVKERKNDAFFETTYWLSNYKMKVVSISTAFVAAMAYEKGDTIAKSISRATRSMVKQLVPAPRRHLFPVEDTASTI